MTKILVLGAAGMLGNAAMRLFAQSPGFDVQGTVRLWSTGRQLPEDLHSRLISGVDVEQFDSLIGAFAQAQPDVVINCIGIVKQLSTSYDPLVALPLNAMLPHRLARLCALASARLVHVSTDCVFTGRKGAYVESDPADAEDLYGRSKLLGEVDYPHAVTLRTSIIGHELEGARSLLCWFLAQQGGVKGFTRAIFSGLPTVELCRVIRDYVLPNPGLRGLYHVSAAPIDKFQLLNLLSVAYDKHIEIEPDDALMIDRSLDCSRFRAVTGFEPKSWPELVASMAAFR